MFGKKAQQKYARRVAATSKAAEKDAADKAALVKKMKKGGRLTREELKLARRMGLGEADE